MLSGHLGGGEESETPVQVTENLAEAGIRKAMDELKKLFTLYSHDGQHIETLAFVELFEVKGCASFDSASPREQMLCAGCYEQEDVEELTTLLENMSSDSRGVRASGCPRRVLLHRGQLFAVCIAASRVAQADTAHHLRANA